MHRRIRPELAEELPTVSSDGLTYTVKLRSGLRFPDGRPVTAADVKATFEYMLDPNLAPAMGGPWTRRLLQRDRRRRRVHESDARLARPVGFDDQRHHRGRRTDDDVPPERTGRVLFLRALAMAWAFIRPVSTPHAITDLPPPFVGPYRLSSHHEGRTATIDREPSWAANVIAGVPGGCGGEQHRRRRHRDWRGSGHPAAQDQGQPAQPDTQRQVVVGSDVPAIANDPQYADRFFSTPTAGVYFGIFRVDRPHSKIPGSVRRSTSPSTARSSSRSAAARSRRRRGRRSCRRTSSPTNRLTSTLPHRTSRARNDSSQAPVWTRRSSSRS